MNNLKTTREAYLVAAGTGMAAGNREGPGRGAAVALGVRQRLQGADSQEGRPAKGLWHLRPDRNLQGDPLQGRPSGDLAFHAWQEAVSLLLSTFLPLRSSILSLHI